MKKQEILKFYQAYRLYIFPLVVAFSSLILIIFVIYPQTVKLISDQQVAKETESKSTLLEVKAQELEEYDSADLKQKVDIALGAYPADKDFISAMGILQDIIAKSGFNVVAMSLGTPLATPNAQGYNLKVEIVGLQTLLLTLLSNIENSPRLMRISNIQAIGGKDSQATAISFNIDVLYAAAPEGFGSVDSPLPSLSEKDEEIIIKLARTSSTFGPAQVSVSPGPRGKANPFE